MAKQVKPNFKWLTKGNTESSDDLPVLFWDTKPTDAEIDYAYKELLPDEYLEVGFVNWSLERAY